MWVYRVENGLGKGPYWGYPVSRWGGSDHNHCPNHPCPWQDGIPRLGSEEMKEYVCGFKTLEQLHSWFTPEELDRLEELGFYVRRIRAKEVIEGGCQVIFIRE